MKLVVSLSTLLCLVATAEAQTGVSKTPSTIPAVHAPETIRADGIRYGRAHLEHFEADYVTIVHEYGRMVVRWNDLDAPVQQEYAAEHNVAVLAAKPPPPAPPASPKARPAASTPAPAGIELKCVDGTAYHDAVLSSSDPASITIRHRGGVARVDLANITEADRTKFGAHYDEQQAGRYKAEEAEATRLADQAQQNEATMARFDALALSFVGKISQVISGGVLMEARGYEDDKEKKAIINGEEMKVATIHGGSFHYECAFVVGVEDNLVDGDQWKGRVWPAGRYQYTTVMGATRTVPRFATNRDVALRLLTTGK